MEIFAALLLHFIMLSIQSLQTFIHCFHATDEFEILSRRLLDKIFESLKSVGYLLSLGFLLENHASQLLIFRRQCNDLVLQTLNLNFHHLIFRIFQHILLLKHFFLLRKQGLVLVQLCQ